MQRRSLLRLGVLSPVAVFTSRYLGALPSKASTPIDDRERAQQLNRLAADIRTPDDARRLVDFIADLFADTIPHGLLSGSLLKRIAQADPGAAHCRSLERLRRHAAHAGGVPGHLRRGSLSSRWTVGQRPRHVGSFSVELLDCSVNLRDPARWRACTRLPCD